jgi:hypothetical protein
LSPSSSSRSGITKIFFFLFFLSFLLILFFILKKKTEKQGTYRIKERLENSHERQLRGAKLGAVPWTSRSGVDGPAMDDG